jgi:phage FluMu protein Com
MSVAQLWGSGPKMTVGCGACSGTFTQRVPMVDHPVVQCPYCKNLNKLPFTVT